MTKLFLRLVKFYQITVSSDHGFIFAGGMIRCRFYPSCSQYSYEAIKKYGIVRGIFKALIRIARCNPLSKGGIDEIR